MNLSTKGFLISSAYLPFICSTEYCRMKKTDSFQPRIPGRHLFFLVEISKLIKIPSFQLYLAISDDHGISVFFLKKFTFATCMNI